MGCGVPVGGKAYIKQSDATEVRPKSLCALQIKGLFGSTIWVDCILQSSGLYVTIQLNGSIEWNGSVCSAGNGQNLRQMSQFDNPR